jgi:hypothetical protein
LQSCQYSNSEIKTYRKIGDHFSEQWYDSKAEINVYKLSQARYGELRNGGQAILIFVTEDFIPDRQVKYEFGEDKKITVLKLNQIKRFVTGIYDYSMMSSVFLPLQEDGPSIKTTHSSQDWCGHTWLQFNSQNNEYIYKGFSYFQAEADQEIRMKKVYTENDIALIYRINPSYDFSTIKEMIPSPDYLRMKHQTVAAYPVEIIGKDLIDSSMSKDSLREIRIHFTSLARYVSYFFEKNNEFRLMGWTDQYQDSPKNKEMIESKAVLTKSMRTPYWSQNTLADSLLRIELMKGNKE